MVLLLQLNGELPERFPGHERRLYVFACRRGSCRRKDGSVRVVRGVRVWEDEAAAAAAAAAQAEEQARKEEEAKAKKKNDGPGLGEALFGAKTFGGGAGAGNPFPSGANPFGASGSSNPFSAAAAPSANNPFASQPSKAPAAPSEHQQEEQQQQQQQQQQQATSSLSKTFAETLSLDAPPPPQPPPPAEPWPEASSSPSPSHPKPYPTLFLSDADYETLDPTPEQAPANVRVEDADAPEPSILDREAFESTMDATFQKFADRLAQNPDQVIRYEFGGAPLLYSKTDAVGRRILGGGGGGGAGIPGCANCGARRTFEVQLTPNAIAELEADDLSLEGMEWGTIIVGVCERDCVPRQTEKGEAGYLEEWVGVQWEELTKQK
ncbi:hypothetical protein JDV02_003785 [Purpureocillium takamizusanense]|nr:uncharacterized protein JDV02_003785 [Purpureocillium takamizusanense]UNI17444.1 hypothetical protein JDV02_003785 [Purpureocillium takamizusanense]